MKITGRKYPQGRHCEALMVRKDSFTDTIKDTTKLIQLLVTSLNDDKILLSLGIENK